MQPFDTYFDKARQAIDTRIQRICSALPENELLPPLLHALHGGKRVRGFMVVESANIHDVEKTSAEYTAVAIELLHAYSLVHDDLPSMDNDPLRRNQPTIHVKWDEMTAILTGDALLTLAFQTLANNEYIPYAETRSRLIYELAISSGFQGMVHGQMLDMIWERTEKKPTVNDIAKIQSLKTGAIIGWSCKAGAILANADTKPMEGYAENLGIAYQISDDLLDVRGDVKITGKNVGKDEDLGKPTYVSILGVEEAQKQAELYVDQAISYLENYGEKAEYLRELARYCINRNK